MCVQGKVIEYKYNTLDIKQAKSFIFNVDRISFFLL